MALSARPRGCLALATDMSWSTKAAPLTPDSAAWHERCISRLGLRIGFLAASFLGLVGCANPNTYTTPRTIGAWHFQNSIALEAAGAYTPAAPSIDVPAAESETDLVPPTYTLRLGLGRSWEIGARIGNLSSLGGDLKWNFLRSSLIDLAIDPAFQVYEVTPNDSNGISTTFSFYHVPLLVGVNLSRRASLVFTPGVSWGFASGGSERFTNGLHDGSNTSTGALGRFGVGVDLRMWPGVALHPEVTFLRRLGSSDYPKTILYVVGLGINFGAMPNYDDLNGDPPPAPPPAY